MFCKGVWQGSRELKPSEVVTDCDYLGFLLLCQLEHEISGKPLLVALHRLTANWGRASRGNRELVGEHDIRGGALKGSTLSPFQGSHLGLCKSQKHGKRGVRQASSTFATAGLTRNLTTARRRASKHYKEGEYEKQKK